MSTLEEKDKRMETASYKTANVSIVIALDCPVKELEMAKSMLDLVKEWQDDRTKNSKR